MYIFSWYTCYIYTRGKGNEMRYQEIFATFLNRINLDSTLFSCYQRKYSKIHRNSCGKENYNILSVERKVKILIRTMYQSNTDAHDYQFSNGEAIPREPNGERAEEGASFFPSQLFFPFPQQKSRSRAYRESRRANASRCFITPYLLFSGG